MQFPSRAILAILSLLVWAGQAAASEPYPSKPIRFIVPYPAGGPTDILGRAVAQRLDAAWGQPVVVDNRPGASGNLGSDMVAKAPPDGYTIGLGNNATHATNASLYAKMPYDTVADFSPITLVASVTNVVTIHPSVPARTLQDLIALAKAQPGVLDYASTGSGSAAHLTGEMFKRMADVDMVHIPYRGSAPAVTDLLSGQVKLMFATLPTVLPHIQAGRLRALATTGAQRSSFLPDIPTVSEAGLSGFESDAWFGILAPVGTPRPIIDQLNRAIITGLQAPEVRQRLAEQGFDVVTSTPKAFARHIEREMTKWAKIVQESGAHVD